MATEVKPHRTLTEDEVEEAVQKAARLAAPVFKANGWTYSTDKGRERYQPDALDLADTIRRLVRNTEDDGVRQVSSGRFTVRRYVDDLGTETVEVRMDLASAHASLTPE